jgi:hypothetical protein
MFYGLTQFLQAAKCPSGARAVHVIVRLCGLPKTTPVASRTQRLLDAFTLKVRPSSLTVPTPDLKQHGLQGVVKLMANGGPTLVCTTVTFELSPKCVQSPSRADGGSGGPVGGDGDGAGGGDGPARGAPAPATGAKRISAMV